MMMIKLLILMSILEYGVVFRKKSKQFSQKLRLIVQS